MQITAELSLYPLDDDYLTAVVTFIRSLQESRVGALGGIRDLLVNQMSTQLSGEADAVHGAIARALARVHQAGFRVSLVAKYLNTDLPLASAVDLEAALAAGGPANEAGA